MQTQRSWGWGEVGEARGRHLLLGCRGERLGGGILRGGWGAGRNWRHGTALFQQLYGLCMMLVFGHETVARLFKWELLAVKVQSFFNFFQQQNGALQKKRQGHNFEFSEPALKQGGKKWVSQALIQWGVRKIKIVAVSFFFDIAYFS